MISCLSNCPSPFFLLYSIIKKNFETSRFIYEFIIIIDL